MVFSSFPIYLDPPNWNQQQQPPSTTTAGINHGTQLPSLLAELPPQPPQADSGTPRPVSMAERARVAKIPQPEPALKCPRCDSTNTKFCYFNNYSLSQPRHFCKTCRRYWTRGGALRNVPVGGGCRRNKRSKPGSSCTTSTKSFSGCAGASSSTTASGSLSSTNILPPPQPLPPFMSSFQPLSDYSATNIGLNFAGIHAMDPVDYHHVGSGAGVGFEQWRMHQMQQFPFMGGGLDVSPAAATATVAGLFPFDAESEGFSGGRMFSKTPNSGLISQMASVKMEDSSHGLNLQRHYLGVPGNNDQYWDGGGASSLGNGTTTAGGWLGDLSGFNSSSSGNML